MRGPFTGMIAPVGRTASSAASVFFEILMKQDLTRIANKQSDNYARKDWNVESKYGDRDSNVRRENN
jgi:hypothetical protein